MIAEISIGYDITPLNRIGNIGHKLEIQADEMLDSILSEGMDRIRREMPRGVRVFVTHRDGKVEEI